MNRVKSRSFKIVSLILLVFFSLTIVSIASPGSPRIFVDPPEIRDDSKQAGSTFTVGINVSDVTDLYGWQANMSWDPSILEVNWHRGYENRSGEDVGHANGTETVFQLKYAPVQENSETIYVFIKNEDLGHGDDETTTFSLDYKPAKNDSETIYVPITAEAVGTGDGSTDVFYLDHAPVRNKSETIYVDGVPQARRINYTIDYPSGNVTFILDSTPANGAAITADYEWLYGERDVDYTINYTTGNVTFTDPPPTCTDLDVDYGWLNYTRNVHYTINYTSGEVTFNFPPPLCTYIGADYTSWRHIYHVYEAEFLSAIAPFDSHPYNHASEPYWEQIKVSTMVLPTAAGWMPSSPFAFLDYVSEHDESRAYSVTANAEVELSNFGFDTGSMVYVAELEVIIECNTTVSDPAQQDKLEIEVTNDGGITWSPTAHTVDVYESEINQTVDVIDDFSWTRDMLTNAKFKVRMKHVPVGTAADEIRVNYFRVRAVDTIIVDDPGYAYDQNTATYASFSYASNHTRGNFTVYDFAHDFPSGCLFPKDEPSKIDRVDFNMRYSANASTQDDKYKIAYYVDPDNTTETVLQDWTNSSTSLNTTTWENKPEPNGGGWNWFDVSNIRIVVEIEKSGGDPDAFFREYEAWVTVWFKRPTRMDKNTQHMDEGYCLFSVITEGEYPSVSGSGTLASVEFEVLAYGETVLNITEDSTWLRGPPPPTPPPEIPSEKGNGYFCNVIRGDFDKDKDVDPSDFAVFAGAYGTSPPSNPACDFDDDGDVDPSDFAVFAGNYGRSV